MHRLRDDDDGAVAVIVAMLMVGLLGFLAIVVDVGMAYAERRQLQNGADAAVLAVAQDCPGPAKCDLGKGSGSTAGRFADSNANDGQSTVTDICGRGANLSPCSGSEGEWDCRPLPSSGPLSSADHVQVRTLTRHLGDGSLLPAQFSRLFGHTELGPIRACARASWGGPSGLTSQLPLTISACEFNKYTTGGLMAPPFTAAMERKIYFHNNTTKAPTCPSGPAGSDLAGGFGWLDTNEDCVATTSTTGYVDDSTGAPPPVECSNAELKALIGKIVNVPIFDETNGLTGANGAYHIKGYAAFYLTGYVFPGSKEKSILSGSFPCGGADHCISGVFTTDDTATSGTIGGPSMGTTVFQMSG